MRLVVLVLGVALLGASRTIHAQDSSDTTGAVLEALRVDVDARLAVAKADTSPAGRTLARLLTRTHRLLRPTGRPDHAIQCIALARALGPLSDAVPAGSDAALDKLIVEAVDAQMSRAAGTLHDARDLADFVPSVAGKKRTGKLADRCSTSLGRARSARFADDFDTTLREAARAFRVCDRASRTARNLGAEATNLDWLKTNLFTPTCATASCHSVQTAKGGLVLEGNRPFAELVGVRCNNANASAAGKIRVKSGDPLGSFLYQKIAGMIAADEGDPMPQVGISLPPEMLLRVRRWIEYGAEPASAADIDLPEPASGFQIRVPQFSVPAGTEVQGEYYVKAPIDQPAVMTRIEFVYPPGSHHFNIFTSDVADVPDGTFRPTFDAVPFDTWSMRASSQRERLDWTFPAGVGVLLNPHQQMMGQIHFVNAGPQVAPLGGMAVVNVHTESPDQVPQRLGTMFGQNKFVSLPPHAESSFDFGTTFIPFGITDEVTVAATTGHFHWRGKAFETRLWDGLNQDANGFPLPGEFDRMGPEKTIFKSEDWNEPPFKVFQDGSLKIPPGWGVIYRCTYFNPGDTTITFGPHVETQEHANLFVYFYPGPPSGKTLSFPLPVQN